MPEQEKTLSAGILIIGNEVLSGRTQDINIQFLATSLGDMGIRVREVRIVADIHDSVIGALNDLRKNYTYVFTTGGIGPTHDDITAECVARAFGVDLPVNEEARQILVNHYGADEVTEARLRMARIPQGATLIQNPISAAPGFRMENVFTMAGVPRIMQGMFDFVKLQLDHGTPMLSNTITCQLAESAIAIELEALQKKAPDVEIGSYPSYRQGVAGVSLVLRSINRDALKIATEQLFTLIRSKGVEPRSQALQVSPDNELLDSVA